MQCPKCQTPAEDFQTSAGVTVNFCQGCKGLWFDQGEFARYCQTASDLSHLTSRLQEAHPTSFTCPRCVHSLLFEIPYQKGGALLIDWCPACHGVWLDAGELQKIQRLAPRATSRSTPPRGPATVDWRQACGWLGSALLLLAMVWPPCEDGKSLVQVLGPLGYTLVALVAVPVVLTSRRQYWQLMTVGGIALVMVFGMYTRGKWRHYTCTSPPAGAVALVGAVCLLATCVKWVKVKSFGPIDGREIQVTLRDESEERMLKQLTPLLTLLETQDRRYQANPTADWCPIHHCRMSSREQDGQLSSAHRLDTGQWCQGA